MAYAISRDEKSPSTMLRRVARGELKAALRQVESESRSVHPLRKNIKKTRGLLRLFAPRFDDFPRENKALSEAAFGVSGMRDAEVMRATLLRLGREGPDLDGAAAARAMLEALRPLHTEIDAAAFSLFAERISEIRKRAKHWKVRGKGWPAYEDGLLATLEDCRKRMKKARASGKNEDLHAWRTRVKQHWYHTRLLAPIWPEMLHPREDALDILGELVGDHHDLHVLALAAPEHLAPEPRSALTRLIETEMTRLESEAFALGARLFAEKPAALGARWGGWYRLWKA
ncbi:CHAD domain-containing protein [Thioclava atlantica]|uniref:CHAD domain-containing protein n=1 Tax=Thioclava atlantica TaxID=1317124 RepID=A0A085U122_9RHOB|nr:CHAD domain-containing protein [Thioclava atlantica]KFE36669.1 CHAD domain-containing protein [Thioclava atlantica]